MGIPEENKNRTGSIFKVMMVENFLNLGREMDIQNHEAERMMNKAPVRHKLHYRKSKTKNSESNKRTELYTREHP